MALASSAKPSPSSPTDPAVRRILGSTIEKMESGFDEVLRRAKVSREISPRAPVEDLAKMPVMTTQCIALPSKVQPERALIDSVLPTTLAMLKTG